MRMLARILGPMPFARLSATHAACNAADSFFAVSLAGSLFFNVSVNFSGNTTFAGSNSIAFTGLSILTAATTLAVNN